MHTRVVNVRGVSTSTTPASNTRPPTSSRSAAAGPWPAGARPNRVTPMCWRSSRVTSRRFRRTGPGRWPARIASRIRTRDFRSRQAPHPQRPRRTLRLRRARHALVTRAEGEARASALARRAAGPEGPRDRGARGGARRLRAGPGHRRPGLHRRAREGHAARREGADRGVQRPRRARAGPQGHDLPGPHGERRAAPDPALAGTDPRPQRGRPGAPRQAGRRVRRAGHGRPLPQRGRAGHHSRQAFRDRGGRAARGLRPGRGAPRPLPAARHQGPGRHRAGHAGPAGAGTPRSWRIWNSGSPVTWASRRRSPRSARSTRAPWTTRSSPRWCRWRRPRRRWRRRSG
ncbi:hypothetical protein QF027_001647 [Streptomyces canus]|nr:hypothetical protein [Streptomyces canus]